jgi:PPOX class probable F420-dependent enzyme
MSMDDALAFILEEPRRLARLATTSAAGEPHVAPVWVAVEDGALLVHTMAESRKALNTAETGRFSLTVDKETLPYRGVILTGSAEVAGEDAHDWRTLIVSLAVAYGAGAEYGEYIASIPGEHVTLVLRPERVESWDYSQVG